MTAEAVAAFAAGILNIKDFPQNFIKCPFIMELNIAYKNPQKTKRKKTGALWGNK